jgi:hypothetical protein
VQTQLLVAPDLDFGTGEFGYSVTVSQDERWMYIGAPGNNKVYAYGRVDVPAQVVTFIATGSYQVYNVGGLIEFDNNEQLAVVLNNQLLTLNTDYTVAGTVINLATVPTAGQRLIITRKVEQEFTGDGIENEFDLEPYLYTATNIYSFSVYVNDVIQRPEFDYDFNSDSAALQFQLVFTTPPALNATIKVLTGTYWQYIDTITVDGLSGSARFGSSVTTTTDGRQVMIGSINDSADLTHPRAGSVYVFDRNVQKFIYGTGPISSSFTVLGTVTEPVSVLVNNTFLVNEESSVLSAVNTFTVSGNTVTINADLQVGDIVEIETNGRFERLRLVKH